MLPIILSLLLSLSLPSSLSSSPLSTIAISHIANQTIICALFPSLSNSPYDLNCTSFPARINQSYPSGAALYSAVAAGDGFLCALSSLPSSNLSAMRWWDFARNESKRVYYGPTPAALAAGDSRVCGLVDGLRCWRWPELSVPAGLNLSGLAVGKNFVCGLVEESGLIRCFGEDSGGVVGNEPRGSYVAVYAGSCHACGISTESELVCWGEGAVGMSRNASSISSAALGENRTCALDGNGMLQCWGEGFGLSSDLMEAEFMGIVARGRTFCGVLIVNFSLVCWGEEVFRENPVVFERVLPASCSNISSCSCGIMPDSGIVCVDGGICRPCSQKHKTDPPPTRNSTVPDGNTDTSSNNKGKIKTLFIVLGSVGLVMGIAVVSCILYIWHRKRTCRVHDSGRLPSSLPTAQPRPPDPSLERRLSQLLNNGPGSTIEEFPLQSLLDLTKSFSEDRKIGSGSFGTVYRAALGDGRAVAIKRAEPFASSSAAADNKRRERERAFVSELALLSRVNHKNLLRLLGYCKESAERILVYEYIYNGSLHDHLHKTPSSSSPPLSSWASRIRIALDAARGIEYLHSYAVPPIIHRDIKSSNILLDENWTAKVADFGLSLMSPDADNPQSSLRAAGTVGYMDPEYYRLQHLTAKSDVYSFGVVLLELLTGYRAVHRHEESGTPRNVVEYAVPYIESDSVHRVLDRRLPPPAPSEIEAVAFAGYLAADCVSPEGRKRPTMTEIVGGLDRALTACMTAHRPLTRSSTTRSM